MIHQAVFDTAETLYRKGVRHVVLSPGSRNAPLTISFVRHPNLKIYSIIDERSAGFIALGIALSTKSPVAICCTSGTALLNYLPAIAEAYYQQVPLVVISADRPPEWIDQRDGQTINQVNAAANFVKGFYQMPASLDHASTAWEYTRKLNEAVNVCLSPAQGPVHINVPFREPFYPDTQEKLAYSEEIQIIAPEIAKPEPTLTREMISQWKSSKKKLMVVGQNTTDPDLKKLLINFTKTEEIPIVTDIISNMNEESFIRYHDHFLAKLDDTQSDFFQPELLISCGKSVISKSLKVFLRKHKPKYHWHFEDTDHIYDTFQSLTSHMRFSMGLFLEKIAESATESTHFDHQLRSNYLNGWMILDEKAKEVANSVDQSVFSEYSASHQVSTAIPKDYIVHLANSMPVRYANLLRSIAPEVSIYCNRGTSGIDGSNGTAVGHALSDERNILLWTGDLSFFYDRNAFFHHHDLSNMRIIVMNNQGGGIFRLIDGPRALPELEHYFETRHNHSARFLADEFDFNYLFADSKTSLIAGLEELFDNKPSKKILEVFTDPSKNEEVYNSIKNTNYE